MKISLKIEGMSCMHCVSSVKNALEEIDGVKNAEVSLSGACAEVDCDDTVSENMLKKIVCDIGFEVK